jgi:lactate permease
MAGMIGMIPLFILFGLLGFTRIPAHAATPFALAVAWLLAGFYWEASANLLAAAAGAGVITAFFPIIWVIFAAVFVFFVCTESGAIETIRQSLVRICPERGLQAVLIAFCFGGFLEAVAGFGSAVAIPTAMLIALGFEAVGAVLICLVANSVPVAFGALGIPLIVLAQETDLELMQLTRYCALQLFPFAVLVPLVVCLLAGQGQPLRRRMVLEVVLIGFVFASVQTLAAFFIGPELVAIAASLASMAFYLLLFRLRNPQAEKIMTRSLVRALSPFLLLLLLVLTTRLLDFPVLKTAPFTFVIGLHRESLKIDWLITPGTLLLLSAALGGLAQGLNLVQMRSLLWKTFVRIRWTVITVVCIVVTAKVMTASGMIESAATLTAVLAGAYYPLIAPLLGALGTFVTGSDTSSNILLGQLQKQTALSTGFDPHWLVASNAAGATAGKMISPQSIAVATAAIGIESRQRDVFRAALAYCAVYVLLMGVLVLTVASML